ncbi:MAG: glycosyltransferase family 39 protein [Rhodanobacteraceae bacterium]
MHTPLSRARGWLLRDARVEVIVFFVFALLLLGIGIGLRDPWPADEPRFALVAREMLRSGQWLFPHRGVELYSDKPPLFMWLEAIAYFLAGGWRGWFLLPSLAAGLGTLALTYDFARRLWNHRTGLLAAAAVLVSFDFTFQMRAAQIDALEVFWLTLANVGLLRHFLLGPNWRWYLIGCLAAGLGVITKGVGVLALLMFAPYVFACSRGWRNVTRVRAGDPRWWLGLLAFLLPILAWALPMLVIVHADGDPAHAHYAHDLLLGQTVSRYAHATHHLQAWYYYLAVIAFQWLPLSLALPWAIPVWLRRLRRHDARILLPLAWMLIVVVFFSITAGKRNVYIRPAMPITALALAPLLPGIVRNLWFRRTLWAIALLIAAVLLIGGALMHGGYLQTLTTRAAQALDASPAPVIAMIIGVGAAGVLIALLARPRRALLGWAAFALALWGTWGLVGYPLLNGYSSARDVMARSATLVPRDEKLALVAWKEQNLLMWHALGRVGIDDGFLLPWHEQLARALTWQAQDPKHRWIFALGDVLAPCVRVDHAIHVGHANRREWYLFQRDAVVPGCVPPTSDDAGQFGAYDPDAE